MNKVNGFTTLTVTLMLVSILISVSVFIGKALVSEKRIALNEIEYRVAFAAAEKGVAEAIAELKVNPLTTVVSGSVGASAASATYIANISPAGVDGVKQVVSTASLAGSGATTISVQVAERSLLNPNNSGPAAPIMVNGKLELKGNYSLVVNPNGGGPGVPVSLWTTGDGSVGGSAASCGQESSGGGCSTDTYTDKNKSGLDVVEKDTVNFPKDMVDYIFGIPDTPDGWKKIESMGTKVSDCSDMGNMNGGLYIVETSCEINNKKGIIGSKTDPVILVVKDAKLKFTGGEFYGFLFSYASDPVKGTASEITFSGNGKLYGSLLANHGQIKNMNGTYTLYYDMNIYCALAGCEENKSGTGGTSTSNFKYGYIPGSWKDW